MPVLAKFALILALAGSAARAGDHVEPGRCSRTLRATGMMMGVALEQLLLGRIHDQYKSRPWHAVAETLNHVFYPIQWPLRSVVQLLEHLKDQKKIHLYPVELLKKDGSKMLVTFLLGMIGDRIYLKALYGDDPNLEKGFLDSKEAGHAVAVVCGFDSVTNPNDEGLYKKCLAIYQDYRERYDHHKVFLIDLVKDKHPVATLQYLTALHGQLGYVFFNAHGNAGYTTFEQEFLIPFAQRAQELAVPGSLVALSSCKPGYGAKGDDFVELMQQTFTQKDVTLIIPARIVGGSDAYDDSLGYYDRMFKFGSNVMNLRKIYNAFQVEHHYDWGDFARVMTSTAKRTVKTTGAPGEAVPQSPTSESSEHEIRLTFANARGARIVGAPFGFFAKLTIDRTTINAPEFIVALPAEFADLASLHVKLFAKQILKAAERNSELQVAIRGVPLKDILESEDK